MRIVRFIGSGGFGDCFLGKWLGVEVAAKCNRDMPGLPACSKVCVLFSVYVVCVHVCVCVMCVFVYFHINVRADHC